MLQANKYLPADETRQGIWGPSGTESIRCIVRHQLPVIAIIMTVITALGLVYLSTAAPIYLATATVVIDAGKAQSFERQQSIQKQQPVRTDNSVDTGIVETQIEILKSDHIAREVIKKLGLTSDPEFVGLGIGIKGLVARLVSIFSGTPILSERQLIIKAVANLKDVSTITRVGQSYLIEIDVKSLDSEKAARTANAIADAYLYDELQAKYAAARRASLWLQERGNELRAETSAAQRAVVEFRARNNIVDTGQGRLMNDQQVSEVNSQLVLAQAATAEAKARYERTREIVKQEFPDASVAEALKSEVIIKLRGQYLDLASREAIWSQKYGPNHLASVNLRSQMHEILRSIKDEMRKIDESAKSDYEIAQTRERSIRDSLSQAVSQSHMTEQAEIQLRELESAAQTAKALYDNFLDRYMQAVQEQSFPITEARVIDPAEPPLSKYHPKTWLVLLLTGVTGIVASFCAASLREFFDRVVRSGEQVEDFLKVKCLAMLPDLKCGKSSSVPVRQNAQASSASRILPKHPQSMLSHVLDAPFSQFTEALRSIKVTSHLRGRVESLTVKCLAMLSNLKTGKSSSVPVRQTTQASSASRILPKHPQSMLSHVLDAPFSQYTEALRSIKVTSDFRGRVESLKVIGLTSTLPHEGKTTTAANIAQLIAQGGCSTILIDADLRKAALSRQLATNGRGLVDVITGRMSIEHVVSVDRRTGLKLLSSGSESEMLSTNELLSSSAMKKVIEDLRGNYAYIIVDLPPLIPIVDARASANFVDAYLLIVEWGRTRIDTIKHSLCNAPELYERLLGVVLNKVDMTKIRRYEPYLGNYYDKYSSQYSRSNPRV